MRTRSLGLLAAALAALTLAAVTLAACADQPGDPEPTPPAIPVSPSPSPSLPSPEPPVPPVPSTPPVGTGLTTLTGEVTEGVEAGCMLLRTSSGDYLLLGETDELRYGQTATVRGRAQPDLATICQQGTPFQVTEVLD